ncbi:hypothetical protein [Streptomyces sp. NPDC046712]
MPDEPNEGSPTVRCHIAVVVPRSRYDVILMSRSDRCRLRGRHRTPVTNS